MGFTLNQTDYGMGTSLTYWLPWGDYVKARVLCSDGKVRATSRLSLTPDTFFSTPAAVTVWKDGKRYTVSGFITVETLAGYTTVMPNDPPVVKFVAFSKGRNSGLLPAGPFRKGPSNVSVR